MSSLLLFVSFIACGAAQDPSQATPPPAAEPAAAEPAAAAQAPEPSAPEASIWTGALTALDGTPLPMETLQGKVTLVVNVASKCGYTPQYEGLQALYERNSAQGFTVLGVPCNQFGGQEPGAPEEIASFCKINFGVSFPLLEKQDVNGPKRSPLYNSLVNSAAGAGNDIGWNFEKFLVNREGKVVKRYGSSVAPDDPALAQDIAAALGG